MKSIELLTEHPKATVVLREWFLKEMYKSFEDKDVPEDLKLSMEEQGVQTEQLDTLIDLNARILFDVLDENKLFINTPRRDGKFVATVNEVAGESFTSRKEAEWSAVMVAVVKLETKLNS